MKRSKFKSQSLTLPKSLTQKEAYVKASKRATRDFRGISYNPKTGKTTLV